MKNIGMRDERGRYSEESPLCYLYVLENNTVLQSHNNRFRRVGSSGHEYAKAIFRSRAKQQLHQDMDLSSYLSIMAPEFAGIDDAILKALEKIIRASSRSESVLNEDLVNAFNTIFDADILDEPLKDAIGEILSVKRETSARSDVAEDATILSSGERLEMGLVYSKSASYQKFTSCRENSSITNSGVVSDSNTLDLTVISTFSDCSSCSSKISIEKQHLCVHYRLHYNSKRMQARKIEGKERRRQIEHTIAARHRLPVFSKQKMSLSRANDFYHNSLEKVAQIERKKTKFAKERGVSYQPRFI